MKKQIKKIVLLIISVFLLYNCCNKKNDIKSHLLNCENIKLNHLWEIISTDSIYYEFYFDNTQQFYYEEHLGAVIPQVSDTSFNSFVIKMCNTDDSLIQKKIVETYFLSFYPKKIKIKYVIPLGDFIYRISKDIHDNYILFGNEASDRYSKYKYGKPMKINDTILEEIILPIKSNN